MIVTLNAARLRTIEEVEVFMLGTTVVGFSPPPKSERYSWIGQTLNQFAFQGYVFAKRYGAAVIVPRIDGRIAPVVAVKSIARRSTHCFANHANASASTCWAGTP